MILSSSEPLELGKVYRIGTEDGPYAVTDGVGAEHYHAALLVIRESSREEYLAYWTEQGNGKGAMLNADPYFYLVSMD